jgi:CHAT domain-containing protein
MPPRLLLIGDSGSEGRQLPGSRREVQKLAILAAAVVPKANITLLVGPAASHDRVLSEIERGDHDLVHFTGHVGMNGEPFLLLYDGYVQGSDLITLLSRRPPAIFVVNGRGAFKLPFSESSHKKYEQGQATAEVLEAETAESKGLAWAAARAGVGAFVGGFGRMTDENAAQFGIAFYRRLFSGQAVAEAFWSARSDTHRTNPDAYLFVLSGYPDVVLCKRKRSQACPP